MNIDYPLLMKKGLVITLTVALLGLLGLYNSRNSATAKPNTVKVSTPPAANSSSSKAPQSPSNTSSRYKDGNYMGSIADTPYGAVRVMVAISGGRISDVHFIQMPNDQRHSIEVTRDSEPVLLAETLDKQSADVDFVSGATSTSYGYKESLQAALDKAAGSSFVPGTYYSAV